MTVFSPDLNQGATRRKDKPSLNLSWALPFLKFVVSIVLVVVLGVAAKHLVARISMPINSVHSDQVFVYQDQEQFYQELNSFIGQNILLMDLSVIKTKLESLPWINSASVSYEWPGKLLVLAVEKRPVAIWNEATLVSQTGDLFEPGKLSFQLPLLSGPENKHKDVLENFNIFNTALMASGYGLNSLELTASGAWSMQLENGIQIYLGRDELKSRFNRAMAILNSANSSSPAFISYLDARYSNGVAVGLNKIEEEDLS